MKHILLVFSDLNESEFISTNLHESAYEITCVSNLTQATEAIHNTVPDLIVINDSTPDNETLKFIIMHEKLNIKSLLITDQKNINLFSTLAVQGQNFVTTHFRPKLLLSMIRAIMNEEILDWAV
ncbi:MAG: hypothetical protein K0Q95_1750 [Bacteroidota bacterium]|jgi:DNA-binding NtrC family response regulator|nr:hypothetical protein [Bacteroidota bacterium]